MCVLFFSARISLSLSSRFPINNLYLYNAKILHKESVCVCVGVISVHPRARSPLYFALTNLKPSSSFEKRSRKICLLWWVGWRRNPEYFKLPIVFVGRFKITWVFLKISVTIISAGLWLSVFCFLSSKSNAASLLWLYGSECVELCLFRMRAS